MPRWVPWLVIAVVVLPPFAWITAMATSARSMVGSLGLEVSSCDDLRGEDFDEHLATFAGLPTVDPQLAEIKAAAAEMLNRPRWAFELRRSGGVWQDTETIVVSYSDGVLEQRLSPSATAGQPYVGRLSRETAVFRLGDGRFWARGCIHVPQTPFLLTTSASCVEREEADDVVTIRWTSIPDACRTMAAEGTRSEFVLRGGLPVRWSLDTGDLLLEWRTVPPPDEIDLPSRLLVAPGWMVDRIVGGD